MNSSWGMPKDESLEPWVSTACAGPEGCWLGSCLTTAEEGGCAWEAPARGAGGAAAGEEVAAAGGTPRMLPHRLSLWLLSLILAVFLSFLLPASCPSAAVSLSRLPREATRPLCLFQAPTPLLFGGRRGS